MLESYKFVSEALEKVEHLHNCKGYDYEKSIARAFGIKFLLKSTYKCHYTFYLAVDTKHKKEWEVNQQDRKWAEFWEEFSVATSIEPEDKEDEGDDEVEEEPEDKPLILKLEDPVAVVRRGAVKEEPDLDDVGKRATGHAIKEEEGDRDEMWTGRRTQAVWKALCMELDASDDSDVTPPNPPRAQTICHTDVKPVIRQADTSTSKSRKRKEPYVPKGTIIDIPLSPEKNNTDDPITIEQGNDANNPITISD